MLRGGPNDTLAGLAYDATVVKFAGVFLGISLTVAAGLALLARRKSAKGKQ